MRSFNYIQCRALLSKYFILSTISMIYDLNEFAIVRRIHFRLFELDTLIFADDILLTYVLVLCLSCIFRAII